MCRPDVDQSGNSDPASVFDLLYGNRGQAVQDFINLCFSELRLSLEICAASPTSDKAIALRKLSGQLRFLEVCLLRPSRSKCGSSSSTSGSNFKSNRQE